MVPGVNGLVVSSVKLDDVTETLSSSWLAPFDTVVSFDALHVFGAFSPAPFGVFLLQVIDDLIIQVVHVTSSRHTMAMVPGVNSLVVSSVKLDDVTETLSSSWLAPFDTVVSFDALHVFGAFAPAPFGVFFLQVIDDLIV